MILLIVGDNKTPIFIQKKNLIIQIPMFERMLSNNLPFSEAIHNKVELPEHDTNLWRSAIEFLKTKEFIPYFKEPVPGEGGNVVRPGSNTLDIHLCIVD